MTTGCDPSLWEDILVTSLCCHAEHKILIEFPGLFIIQTLLSLAGSFLTTLQFP